MSNHKDLWSHQQRVFDLLTEGENVILQAPTGSGKTLAALYPFLYSLDDAISNQEYHNKLPNKCIYSVPMRVLAKQFYEEYSDILEKYRKRWGLRGDMRATIQIGSQQKDRTLEGTLIFATIDQTLSSWLMHPYSQSRGRANLNAGAIMSSYLVFDEFHLFDPTSTLPTTIEMLRRLKGITPFILMTATFSGEMLYELAEMLDATVVPKDAEERKMLDQLPTQEKERRYFIADGPLNAQAVLDQHNSRSLVICNTVARSQHLYLNLREQASDDVDDVILLHSRFIKEDRDAIEDRIRELFAEGNKLGSYIAVATQAIEVGVDITSEVLHTELAPANAVIQRAGRCARYPEDVGKVYIYRWSIADDGEVVDLMEKNAPYSNPDGLFERTLAAFSEHVGETIDFSTEQAIISAAHDPVDRIMLDNLRGSSNRHREDMHMAMNDQVEGVNRLVRNIEQQQVTIHPDPERLLDSPFDVPSFGLHPGTVRMLVSRWLEEYHSSELPWGIQSLQVTPDEDQTNRNTYGWLEVETLDTVTGSPLIVVHPDLAYYDAELGFLGEHGGSWDERIDIPPYEERQEHNRSYTYRLETYAEHIHHVHQAFREKWPEAHYAARQLEHLYGWPENSVTKAAELAILLHDVGKLNIKWQNWVRDYQEKIGMPITDKTQAYAHTELQNQTHREIERAMRRRPWHAMEGAIASHQILDAQLEYPLYIAAYSAIARHHSSFSTENRKFKLSKYSPDHIRCTFEQHNFTTDNADIDLYGLDEPIAAKVGSDLLVRVDDYDGSYLAYLLIVRTLRLADQLGTSRGSR